MISKYHDEEYRFSDVHGRILRSENKYMMEHKQHLLDFVMADLKQGAELGCRHEVARVVADAMFLQVSLRDLKEAMMSAKLDRRTKGYDGQ